MRTKKSELMKSKWLLSRRRLKKIKWNSSSFPKKRWNLLMNKWLQSLLKEQFPSTRMVLCLLNATSTSKGQPCSYWLIARTQQALNNAMHVSRCSINQEIKWNTRKWSSHILWRTRSSKVALSLPCLRKWACLPKFGKYPLKCTRVSAKVRCS